VGDNRLGEQLYSLAFYPDEAYLAACAKRRADKKLKSAKATAKRKTKLTAMTKSRRYNRFWTEEDDHLLRELRAAGGSSVFIGAALK